VISDAEYWNRINAHRSPVNNRDIELKAGGLGVCFPVQPCELSLERLVAPLLISREGFQIGSVSLRTIPLKLGHGSSFKAPRFLVSGEQGGQEVKNVFVSIAVAWTRLQVASPFVIHGMYSRHQQYST
jgi:hypothetical protein